MSITNNICEAQLLFFYRKKNGARPMFRSQQKQSKAKQITEYYVNHLHAEFGEYTLTLMC